MICTLPIILAGLTFVLVSARFFGLFLAVLPFAPYTFSYSAFSTFSNGFFFFLFYTVLLPSALSW